MEIHPLPPIPPEEWKAILLQKGWTAELLAMRWKLTKRRIDQIIADVDRPRYLDDAVNNLPVLLREK